MALALLLCQLLVFRNIKLTTDLFRIRKNNSQENSEITSEATFLEAGRDDDVLYDAELRLRMDNMYPEDYKDKLRKVHRDNRP